MRTTVFVYLFLFVGPTKIGRLRRLQRVQRRRQPVEKEQPRNGEFSACCCCCCFGRSYLLLSFSLFLSSGTPRKYLQNFHFVTCSARLKDALHSRQHSLSNMMIASVGEAREWQQVACFVHLCGLVHLPLCISVYLYV